MTTGPYDAAVEARAKARALAVALLTQNPDLPSAMAGLYQLADWLDSDLADNGEAWDRITDRYLIGDDTMHRANTIRRDLDEAAACITAALTGTDMPYYLIRRAARIVRLARPEPPQTGDNNHAA